MTPITCGPYMQPFWSRLTGVVGTGHCLSGRPALTHTKTFLSVPLPFTTTSSDFCGAPACAWAQAGVADMSMVLAVGAAPEKLTFPVTVAAVASSMVAVGADDGAAASSLAVSGALLPPQPAINSADAAAKLIKILFIANSSLLYLEHPSTAGSRSRAGAQAIQLVGCELGPVTYQKISVMSLVIV